MSEKDIMREIYIRDTQMSAKRQCCALTYRSAVLFFMYTVCSYLYCIQFRQLLQTARHIGVFWRFFSC